MDRRRPRPFSERMDYASKSPCPWRAGLLIFLTCLVFYHANGRPIAEVDCVPAPYEAWSLTRHGSFDLRPYRDLPGAIGPGTRELPDGTLITGYPPGSALAALPIVAPIAAFRERPFYAATMLHLGKFVAALYVAGSVVVFYFLCLRQVPSAANIATVLFGLGTSLCSVASQALWMHGPATFWLCVALYCLLIPPDVLPGQTARTAYKQMVLVGMSLGMALITRPTTALFALATLVALCRRGGLPAIFKLILGAAGPIGFLLAYNLVYFNRPIAGGYGDEASLWTTPLALGFAGLLLAPSRGLLVYSPALVLAPWGLFRLRRGNNHPSCVVAVLSAWSAAAAATILLYAKWHEWHGAWCYGPRFLCETMPILCLLFALAYDRLQTMAARKLAATLVGLSVAVQFLGVFGNDTSWKERHASTGQSLSFFSPRDTQIEAHLRHVWRRLTHE
jgi:hypothetical protein